MDKLRRHCSLLIVRITAFNRPTIGNTSHCGALFLSTKRKLPGREWNDEEVDKLRDLVKQHPSIYVVPNLEAEFPGRTRNEIFWKFVEKTPKNRRWTAEELRTLKESGLAGESWISIQKKIPNRTAKQIKRYFYFLLRQPAKSKAQQPPLQAENSGKSWSTDDIAEVVRLREHERVEWHEIGKKFGRSLKSVYKVFRDDVESRRRPWSKEEEYVLKEMLEARKDYSEISKFLDRTLWSVASKVDYSSMKTPKKKHRPWTQVETDILKGAIRQDVKLAHLQSHLPDRTLGAIRIKLRRLRLENQGQGLVKERPKHCPQSHHWTTSDHAIFEAAWHEGLSEQQIVAKLPHVPPSIIKIRLDVTGQPYVKTWKPEEDDIISNALRKGLDLNQLQAQLPTRSLMSVKKRLKVKKDEIYEEEGVYLGQVRRWSPDEVYILSKAYDEGLRPKDIAKRLPGRTYDMVHSRWRRFHLAKKSHE